MDFVASSSPKNVVDLGVPHLNDHNWRTNHARRLSESWCDYPHFSIGYLRLGSSSDLCQLLRSHGGISEVCDGEWWLLVSRQKDYSAKFHDVNPGLARDGTDLEKFDGNMGLDPIVCGCNGVTLVPIRALRSGTTIGLDHHLSCYFMVTHNVIGFHCCIFLACRVAFALLAIVCENFEAR